MNATRPTKRFAGKRLHGRFNALPKANARGVFRKQLEHQPDRRKLGDAVDRIACLDVIAFHGQLLDDGSALRCINRQPRLCLAVLLQLGELLVGHSELAQPLARIGGQRFLSLSNRL